MGLGAVVASIKSTREGFLGLLTGEKLNNMSTLGVFNRETVALRRWECYKIYLFFSTALIMSIGRRKEIRKLTFRALAFVLANHRIVDCVWSIYRKMVLRYWLVPGNVRDNRINKLNDKRSLK